MYNLASKTLPLFLDPFVVAIVLLVGSFLVRKRRPKVFQVTYVVSMILLLIAGCPTVEGWLTGSLEGQYPDAGADSYPPAQAIVAINTRENALFSHQLLARHGIGRIILVTSAIHMPRATAAFRKVRFEVVAAPADFQTGWRKSSAMFRWIPEAGALGGSSKAIREWLGLSVYRLRGWV